MINSMKEGEICLFENIQTTNSFSLKKIAEYLFKKGCDFIILGEPEHKIENFLNSFQNLEMLKQIPGIAYKDNQKIIITDDEKFNRDLDNLPFPLWEKFNLEGYWNVGFGHPPVKKNSKFVPILSSRGCPFRCKFCVNCVLK